MVHVSLKPGLENFDHYFTSMWDECNCVVVWAFFGIFFWTGMETDIFQSCAHCWVFQICWHIECSTFTASSFRIWYSSTGIPSPPLALFIVMLPKAHLTSHSRMSGSRWVITPLWLSGSWRSFLYSASVYSCHLFLIYSASIRSIIVGSCIRHYWQNGGTAPVPSLIPQARTRDEGVSSCDSDLFLPLFVELAGKNVKVLIVLERTVRKHKAFCSCAQKIIYKVTIDICSRIFAKNVPGWAHRPQLEAMGKIIIWDLFVREMFMAKEVCWV